VTTAVLDASALLAMLQDEPGGDRVREVLAGSAMSTVNLAEIVAHYTRNGADLPEIRAVLDPLPIDYVPPDEALAYDAGRLISATARHGLSLGDRMCLALAMRLGAPALSADRSWAAVAGPAKIAVEVIR